MSRNVVDTTMGIERDLRRRQALLDTKSRVVQAKSELVDKNFGEAAKQLAEGVDALESAMKGAKPSDQTQAMRGLVGQLQEMRLELTMGKPVPIRKLTELQQNLDSELEAGNRSVHRNRAGGCFFHFTRIRSTLIRTTISGSLVNGLIASRPRGSPIASSAAAAVSRVNQSASASISINESRRRRLDPSQRQDGLLSHHFIFVF